MGVSVDPLVLFFDPVVISEREIRIPAQLLRQNFAASIEIALSPQFSVQIDHPLIDISIVHDEKVEHAAPMMRERAVQRSRARAQFSLVAVSAWISLIGFGLFVTGVVIALFNKDLGSVIGIPGMLITPIALLVLLIAGIQSVVTRKRRPRRTNLDSTLFS